MEQIEQSVLGPIEITDVTDTDFGYISRIRIVDQDTGDVHVAVIDLRLPIERIGSVRDQIAFSRS